MADLDPDVWQRSLQIMLTAVFYGCRAAIPAMLARGGGAIVNTASIEAFGGEMMASPYSTAKAGVVNFTRNVAIEYARKGIRANAICPGVVQTPLAELMLAFAKRTREELAALAPQGRLLRPEEIASVVAFLCSDDASADHRRGHRHRRRPDRGAESVGPSAVRGVVDRCGRGFLPREHFCERGRPGGGRGEAGC